MYFDNLRTRDEIKDRYKTLAKRLHPDVGGDKIIMQEINNEYDKALNKIEKTYFSTDENAESKILKVMEWAENNPSFDVSFVDSLLSRIRSGKELTEMQESALNNIITKFKINLTEE